MLTIQIIVKYADHNNDGNDKWKNGIIKKCINVIQLETKFDFP